MSHTLRKFHYGDLVVGAHTVLGSIKCSVGRWWNLCRYLCSWRDAQSATFRALSRAVPPGTAKGFSAPIVGLTPAAQPAVNLGRSATTSAPVSQENSP